MNIHIFYVYEYYKNFITLTIIVIIFGNELFGNN